MKKIVLTFAVTFILFSCKKENTTKFDSFVFGTSYGYCVGNCANFFLIEDGNLYADDMERLTTPLKFKTDKLSVDKYNLAKQLRTDFPAYLKQNPNKTFGCPDCADQGSIYIEATINGKTETWLIDTDTTQQPAAIKNYIRDLRNILTQL
jgi:hypothetical protein